MGLDLLKRHALDKSRFTEFLIRVNALNKCGFAHWIFRPGMLFNAPDKWWGDLGRRSKPHEGLDLCLYGDHSRRILRVDENTRIPVMYDGVVVAIVPDFLGQSVIVEHGLSENGSLKFCTIYGHTNPRRELPIQSVVKAGDIIATIAGPGRKHSDILPHLHISLGWSAATIFYDRLDWGTISAPGMLNLLDPLDILDWPYQVLMQDALP